AGLVLDRRDQVVGRHAAVLVVAAVAPNRAKELLVSEQPTEHMEDDRALLVEVAGEDVHGGGGDIRHDRAPIALFEVEIGVLDDPLTVFVEAAMVLAPE